MMEFPYFKAVDVNGSPSITSDVYFCEKARRAGYDIVTDCGVQCLHVDKERGVLYGHPEIVDHEKNEIKEQWHNYFAM